MTVSTVAALAPYFSSYSTSTSWTVTPSQFKFSLAVNGIQQTRQSGSISIGEVSTSSSYPEVYTLTNQAAVPITITATPVYTYIGAAVFTWLTAPGTSDSVTLGPGQSSDMVLLINDFTTAGTVTVVFNSVQAFTSDPTLAFSFTATITKDEDTGNIGYWALDSYTTNVQVYNLAGDNYVALADYLGTFTTYASDLSPGYGVVEPITGTGTLTQSYEATFTATGYTPPASPTITANDGGTQLDLSYGTYAGQTGDPSPFNWVALYLPAGTSLYYTQWPATYLYSTTRNAPYGGQMWNEYLTVGGTTLTWTSVSNGDIVT